jgi:hypothetical protein
MRIIYFLILSLLFSTIGAQTWNWTLGVTSDGPDNGNAIAYDGAGNIYVAGNFYKNPVIKDSTITNNALIRYSKTGTIVWALNVNGQIKDIATDALGNVYLTGQFKDVAKFGDSIFTSAGQMDVFVTKISPAGKYIWSKHAGGGGYDEPFGIASGNDNTLVVTAFMAMGAKVDGAIVNNLGGGILLIKYSLAGNLIWAKQKGYNDKPMDVKIDADNNIFVSGVFSFSSDFGGTTTITGKGNYDAAFLAKYSSTGDYIWAVTGLSNGNNNAQSLALDNSNNAYITGYFEDTINFGSGITLKSNTSMKDIFVAKYDASGKVQWAKRNGTYDIDLSNSIALQGNHIFITGFMGVDYPTLTNLFINAYDLSGNYLMSVQVDSTDVNEGSAIAADDEGNVYVTGRLQNKLKFDATHSITSFSTNDFDFFVAKLTPAFKPLSIQSISSSGFSIYPNPVNEIINIKFDSPANTKCSIDVINTLGQVVCSKEIFTNNEGLITLDLPVLSRGTYFMVVKNSMRLYSVKFIKQ